MKHPMHIGIVCEEYPPAPHGGTGSIYRDLCEGLVASGHRATVIGSHRRMVIDGVKDETIKGVRAIRIPFASLHWPTRWRYEFERWRIRRWLHRLHRETPFSLVETTDYNGWFSRGTGIATPSVIRMHGSNLLYDAELQREPATLEVQHEIAALHRATHLAALSQYAATRTLALAGLSHRPCEPIHCAVDTEFFSPDHSVPTEPGLIVFVNMINRRKGIEQLVDAAQLVFPSFPHARLVAIGGDTEHKMRGGFLKSLQERVKTEYRDRISFPGRLPPSEVRHWLRRAALCCYPSHIETFGIAPVEAMAVGKAVIFSQRGPGPEVIDHGTTGLLCDPTEVGDIAEKIALLLSDPARAVQIGNTARQTVLTRFDKREWIPRNERFFAQCLRSPSLASAAHSGKK